MNVDLRTISLCSGYGGLDLGVRLAVPHARTVVYVERDPFCASLLVARMEDKTLDRAPIWDDLTTFDGAEWRGAVDLVVAGFPCQEVSVAGARAAQDGARWLWCEVARIIEECGPSYVFLENVPGILSAGVGDPSTGSVQRAIADVLGDLAALGFNAEWGVLGADDVGAPHRRKRWWCLAYRTGLRRREGQSEPEGQQGRPDAAERSGSVGNAGAAPADSPAQGDVGREPAERDREPSGSVADAAGSGLQGCGSGRQRPMEPEGAGGPDPGTERPSRELADAERGPAQRRGEPGDLRGPQAETCGEVGQPHPSWHPSHDSLEAVADANLRGCEAERLRASHDGQRTARGDNLDRCHPGAWPPGPNGDWSNVHPRFWPATQPGVRGATYGSASRVDRLRALGNGVCPQQAAAALLALSTRAGIAL